MSWIFTPVIRLCDGTVDLDIGWLSTWAWRKYMNPLKIRAFFHSVAEKEKIQSLRGIQRFFDSLKSWGQQAVSRNWEGPQLTASREMKKPVLQPHRTECCQQHKRSWKDIFPYSLDTWIQPRWCMILALR